MLQMVLSIIFPSSFFSGIVYENSCILRDVIGRNCMNDHNTLLHHTSQPIRVTRVARCHQTLNLVTGRNEVVAKVMFLQVSVIHSVHRGGGGLPQCMLGYHPPGTRHPPRPGTHPPDRHTPRPGTPPRDQADTPPGPGPGRPPRDPPGKQTPAYGLRAAGTHPTGMHSTTIVFVLSCTYI